MAELNSGVNKFQVNAAGDNGKIAFTTDAPNGVGFAESTHHFAKTADDMGVFVYTNDATSIKIWQKIDGSWLDCGSTGGQLGFPWHGSFAWRDGATHMHIQLDGPNNANESIRIIKIEGNMFASFDGTTSKSVLLLNDSVVEDVDDDGDIEVTSGVGYNVVPVGKDNTWIGGSSVSFNIPTEIDLGVFILNDTRVIPFTNVWDGTKNTVTFDLEQTPGRSDSFVLYYREPQTYSGNVSDGAISGATVTDIATGITTTTDSEGNFTFASKPAGDIEAEGGVDVVTGDAYVGKMKGNSKYSIISPLSTVAVEVAEDQGITFDQAVDDILDNSVSLFGIDFPKEDKLELLNKRFVDEAAKGNSKAVRGSALIAMIDTAAELVGESLTHLRDGAAGDLATDAVDGKRQAYRGIARLVRNAKEMPAQEREDLSRPLAIDAGRVSDAVAIRKGAAAAEVEEKNERSADYKEGVSSLLENRMTVMSDALSSKYDENYAITRIQSIAKTAKNEDKTALEGFKGDVGEVLAPATVDNSKLNQIGDTPNKVVEEVKYTHSSIGSVSNLTFTYGDVVKTNPLGLNLKAEFTYFKELQTGTQLYYGDKGADNSELDLLNLTNHFDFGLPGKGETEFTRAKTMSFEDGDGTTYTVNYTGVILSIEEQEEPVEEHIKSTGSYSLSSPIVIGNIVGAVTAGKNKNELTFNDGITHFQVQPAEKAGTFNISQVDISGLMTVIANGVSFVEDSQQPGNETLSFTQPSPKLGGKDIAWNITYSASSGEEPVGGDKLRSWEGTKLYEKGPKGWTLSSNYEIDATGVGHKERGLEYRFTPLDLSQVQTRSYKIYDGDMDNVYKTEMKVETPINITWSGSEALFSPDGKSEWKIIAGATEEPKKP